jgi:hypothetical protein
MRTGDHLHPVIEYLKNPEALKYRPILEKYAFDGIRKWKSNFGDILIDGLLPGKGTGLIIGQSGAGKTFTAVDLAVALASRQPFFGRRVVWQTGVCIITAEGSRNFPRRIEACKNHRGVNEALPIVYRPFSGNLNSDLELDSLLKELGTINRLFDETGDDLGLVIIDTVSASFAMKDQNNPSDVLNVCKRMQKISDSIKGFVFGVHHLGKDEAKDAVGSYAWRANVDVIWSLTMAGDRVRGQVKGREFCIAKNRDGIEGPVSCYELKSVTLGFEDEGYDKHSPAPADHIPIPITSCVIEPVKAELPKKREKPQGTGKRLFYECLEESIRQNPIRHQASQAGQQVDATDYKKVRALFYERYPGSSKAAARSALNEAYQSALSTAKIETTNIDGIELIWKM